MNHKQMQASLRDLTQTRAPEKEIDLWPAILSRLQTSDQTIPRGTKMNAHLRFTPRFYRTIGITLAVLLAGVLFFVTPQGQVLAQSLLRYFTRAESSQLPLQSWQLTPIASSATPGADPANILDAHKSIEEIQQKAGVGVHVPGWLPDTLHFAGASVEQDQKIVRVFYQSIDSNGLVLRQEPIPMKDDCELCGKVGADAAIEKVSIAGNEGEYAEGVWKLTDQGPVWEADPYLKTMRWQENGMAFELLYMGPPETLTKDDLIAIAVSIK